MNTLNKITPPAQYFRFPLKGGGLRGSFGFTLVELIVVISILAILGTIAFLSFGGFSSKARDGSRISDTASLSKGLELYQVQSGKYPAPENISGTGIIGTTPVAYLGTIQNQISNLTKISKTPKDPLSDNYYIYGTTSDYKQYQIATTLENTLSMNENIVYADGPTYTARVTGNYKGLIKFTPTGTAQTWVTNIPSLIYNFSGSVSDLITDKDKVYFITNKNINLPYKIKEAIINNKTADTIIQELTNTGVATLTGVQITNLTQTGITEQFTNSPLLLASFGGDLTTLTNTILGTSATSSAPTYLDCTFNSTPVPHSTSVTAYLTTSVPFGNTCTSEQRTCNNGTLSGTYTFTGCTVAGATGTFNLSATSVTQGTNVTISNNCSTPPTSYTSSNTAVATIVGTTITTLSAGTTNITPVGGACADIVAKPLTVISQQWKDIAGTSCTQNDITIGGKTWAGCNSILGTGLIYNANNYCRNYAGTNLGGTSCYGDTTKENAYNSTYGVDNIWGKLYLWANAPSACPTGWHLPSDTEFEQLETTLNGGTNCRNATDGRLCTGLGWSGYQSKTTTNNIIQALKLPLAGNRDSGTFYSRGSNAGLWSSTEYDATNARGRNLHRDNAGVYRNYRDESSRGFSVRCIKD